MVGSSSLFSHCRDYHDDDFSFIFNEKIWKRQHWAEAFNYRAPIHLYGGG